MLKGVSHNSSRLLLAKLMSRTYHLSMGSRYSIRWQERARCHSLTALFFSERDSDKDRAKAICRQCPVKKPCLAYALLIREPHGIWGGTDGPERRKLKEFSSFISDFDGVQADILNEYDIPEEPKVPEFNFHVSVFNFHVDAAC